MEALAAQAQGVGGVYTVYLCVPNKLISAMRASAIAIRSCNLQPKISAFVTPGRPWSATWRLTQPLLWSSSLTRSGVGTFQEFVKYVLKLLFGLATLRHPARPAIAAAAYSGTCS